MARNNPESNQVLEANQENASTQSIDHEKIEFPKLLKRKGEQLMKQGLAEKGIIVAMAGVIGLSAGKAEAVPVQCSFDQKTNAIEMTQGEHRLRITDMDHLSERVDAQSSEMLRRIASLDYTPQGVNASIRDTEGFRNEVVEDAETAAHKLNIDLRKRDDLGLRELVLLSSQVVSDKMDYDFTMISKNPGYSETHEQMIDALPIDDVYRGGKGVCRQFSVAEREVFRILQKTYRPDISKGITYGSVGSISDLHAWNFFAQNVNDEAGNTKTELIFTDVLQVEEKPVATPKLLSASDADHQNIAQAVERLSRSSALTDAERLDFVRTATDLTVARDGEIQPSLASQLAWELLRGQKSVSPDKALHYADDASRELGSAKTRLEKVRTYRDRHYRGNEPSRLDFYSMARLLFRELADKALSPSERIMILKKGFKVAPELSADIARMYEREGKKMEAQEWYEHVVGKGMDLFFDNRRVQLADFSSAYAFFKKNGETKGAQRARKFLEIQSRGNDPEDRFNAIQVLAQVLADEGSFEDMRSTIVNGYEDIRSFTDQEGGTDAVKYFAPKAAELLEKNGYRQDAQRFRTLVSSL